MMRITINAQTLEEARGRALDAVRVFLGLADGAPVPAPKLIACVAGDCDEYLPFRLGGNETIYNWETTWEFRP